MMTVYHDAENVVNRELLTEDKLAYAVLFNVLGGKVKKIITDHERIIIAHTAAVFPTWIWAPDDVTEAELDTIYETIKKEFVPIQDYRFNTKYEIARYLIGRFQQEGLEFHIAMNVAAYECHKPQAPKKQVNGQLEQMKKEDAKLAARLIREASVAIGDRILDEQESVEAAKEQLERQCLFIWRDENGTPVAFCDKNEDEHYVKVSQVYTIPEVRSKGYAGRLVYELCTDIVSVGKTAMLYADADYLPSNRCYQNIGFELKGKIATIQLEKDN